MLSLKDRKCRPRAQVINFYCAHTSCQGIANPAKVVPDFTRNIFWSRADGTDKIEKLFLAFGNAQSIENFDREMLAYPILWTLYLQLSPRKPCTLMHTKLRAHMGGYETMASGVTGPLRNTHSPIVPKRV